MTGPSEPPGRRTSNAPTTRTRAMLSTWTRCPCSRLQIHRDGRPVRTHDAVEFGSAFDDRATILRRRLHDSGWTEGETVPTGCR